MQKILSIPGMVVLLVGIGLLLSGFISNPVQEATIQVNETSVHISNRLIATNEPVEFIITNTGKIPILAAIKNKSGALSQAIKDDDQAMTTGVEVLPGETHTFIWTFSNPGRYQLTCYTGGQNEYDLIQPFTVGMAKDNGLLGWTGGWLLGSLSALLLAGTGLGIYSMTARSPILRTN